MPDIPNPTAPCCSTRRCRPRPRITYAIRKIASLTDDGDTRHLRAGRSDGRHSLAGPAMAQGRGRHGHPARALIELETDKVTVEVPAPASGVLREIVKAEQEEIAPGEVLGRLETRRRSASTATRADARAGLARYERDCGRGGKLAECLGRRRARCRLRRDARSGCSLRACARLLNERGSRSVDDSEARARAVASRSMTSRRSMPRSRRMRRRRACGQSEGTRPRRLATPSPEPPASLRQRAIGATDSRRSHSVPHTAVRKRIAEHMVQSLLQTAPHVTTVFEADLTAVMAHRSAHRAEFRGARRAAHFHRLFPRRDR